MEKQSADNGEIKEPGDLPFVKDTPARRDFWAVQSTGDPWQDDILARDYASKTITFIRHNEAPPLLLFLIQRAMVGHPSTEIQVSFWEAIQDALRGEPSAN